MAALKLGQLPHTGIPTTVSHPPPPPLPLPLPHCVIPGDGGEAETHPADAWLGAVAQGTMEMYVSSILQIPSLGEEASQQLAADIGVETYTHTHTRTHTHTHTHTHTQLRIVPLLFRLSVQCVSSS